MADKEDKGMWQANENKLLWFNILETGVETIEGQFGFLDGIKIFIVHKTSEPEQAIAIPEEVMQQALSAGWFKRGNRR